MAIFVEAVEDALKSLLQYKRADETEDGKNSLSWNYICKDLVNILQKYPTGVTQPVILSELLLCKKIRPSFWHDNNARQLRDNKSSNRSNKILEILENKQVDFSCVLECFIKEAVRLNGSETLILKLIDSKYNTSEENTRCIEMYLHQKMKCCEEVFKKHPLLMTGLRLHKLQNKGLHRLLPTEYVVPVLNHLADKDFVESRFSTLEGIEREDKTPHYTRNVLLMIKKISPVETIHLPYGDSVHRIIMKLFDNIGNEIELYLWDENTSFANIFNQEDTLAIEEPFLVTEDGKNCHLEYGPATIFYIIPSVESTAVVPSQVETSTVAHVKMTSDGKLDFDSYKVRSTSKDIQRSSIHVCFLCLVHTVSPKKSFQDGRYSGHHFDMTVLDEFGKLTVDVFDEAQKLHEIIYPGQMIFLENISVDDAGKCLLRTWELGRLHNISLMKGYISSPCLYNLTTIIQGEVKSNIVVAAKIVGLVEFGQKRTYCTRVHFSCLKPVKEMEHSGFYCPKCDCSSIVAYSNQQTMEDVSKLCIWRFSVGFRIEISHSKDQIECSSTEQFCQDLLQISASDFVEMNEKRQKSVLNNLFGKTLVFSISLNKGIYLLNAYTEAPGSFLNNLLLQETQRR